MALHNQSLSFSAPKISIPIRGTVENTPDFPERPAKTFLGESQRGINSGGAPADSVGNRTIYAWGDSFTGKLIQAQTIAFSAIMTCQGFILMKFGYLVFGLLVGTGVWIPLIFMMALVHGLYTYTDPSYWRVSTAILVQGVTSHLSFLLVVKDVKNVFLLQPMSLYFSDAWVAWIVIVAATMTVSVISFVLVIVSLRDILWARLHERDEAPRGGIVTV